MGIMRSGPCWKILLTAAVVALAGCGGEIPDEELGQIIYEVPVLPETKKPYEMPLLETPRRAAAVGPAAPGAVPGS